MKSIRKEPDAGWNDPPKFSYGESLQLTNSPKRNILNKRVAFPMNSTQAAATSQSNIDPTATPIFNSNLPPPPMSTVPRPCDTISDSSKTDDSEMTSDATIQSTSSPPVDEVPDLSYILESVAAVMDEKQETLNSSNKHEMIRKKIQAMEDSWKADKLPLEVKRGLRDLCDALKNKDRTRADQIQIGLMVDHSKLCSEFMSAFRQLINIE